MRAEHALEKTTRRASLLSKAFSLSLCWLLIVGAYGSHGVAGAKTRCDVHFATESWWRGTPTRPLGRTPSPYMEILPRNPYILLSAKTFMAHYSRIGRDCHDFSLLHINRRTALRILLLLFQWRLSPRRRTKVYSKLHWPVQWLQMPRPHVGWLMPAKGRRSPSSDWALPARRRKM